VPRLEELEPRALLSGGLDPGFNSTGKVAVDFGGGAEASGVALQRDGKVVMAGVASRPTDGDLDIAVARVNPDGTPDVGFGTGGRVSIAYDLAGTSGDDTARDVAVQRDGKIVLVGFSTNAQLNYFATVTRLNSDGSLDRGFGTGGMVLISYNSGGWQDDKAFAVALQRDGKIVVAGSSLNVNNNHDFAVARLNPDGSYDAGFGVDGRTTIAFDVAGPMDDNAYAVALQRDGKVVVAGSTRLSGNNWDFALTRLNTNGTPDDGFGTGGKVTVPFDLSGHQSMDEARGVAVQADGKIVATGNAQKFGHDNEFVAARLNPDGTPDAGFGTGGKVVVPFDLGGNNDDKAPGVALQPDGKIIMAGYAELPGTQHYAFAVARLAGDGSLDQSFGQNGKVTVSIGLSTGIGYDLANDVVLQPDGKIVVAGYSWQDNPADLSYFAAVRLLADKGRLTPPPRDVGQSGASGANAGVSTPAADIPVDGHPSSNEPGSLSAAIALTPVTFIGEDTGWIVRDALPNRQLDAFAPLPEVNLLVARLGDAR
jgi:uncharacterized delta-60 repeat protein